MPEFFDSGMVLHGRGTNGAYYQVARQDVSGDPKYYGYTDADGKWLIQEMNTANGTFKWVRGTSDLATNWGLRGSQTYVFWDALI